MATLQFKSWHIQSQWKSKRNNYPSNMEIKNKTKILFCTKVYDVYLHYKQQL